MKKIKIVLVFVICIAVLAFFLAVRSCGKKTTVQSSEYLQTGIDLSSWQKEVDFSKLKSQGINFVILRAGTSYGEDVRFEKYYREAKSAGLDIGCYFYTYSTNIASANEDALMLLKWLKKKKFQFPIYLDVEDEKISSLSVSQKMAVCKQFKATLEDNKYLVGVYSNESWMYDNLDMEEINKEYEVWIAKWTSSGKADIDMSDKCRLWQYSESGHLDGVETKVDFDICYFDYPQYIMKNGLNNYKENSDN